MVRRTKQDAQATRSALLDAAERVFELRGVSRTSLADIAQAAGVTRGALYWHFRDKADLFAAMMERVTLPLGGGLQAPERGSGDALADWCAHLRHALHRIARDEQTRRVLRIAMQKVEHAADLAPAIEQHIRMHRTNADVARQVLQHAARARGVRLPAPATQLAHAACTPWSAASSTAGCWTRASTLKPPPSRRSPLSCAASGSTNQPSAPRRHAIADNHMAPLQRL